MSESRAVAAPAWPTAGRTRFEAAFLDAPIGMSVVSPAGRIVEVNAALCRLLSRGTDELIGTNVLDLIHPDDLRAARHNWRRLVEGGTAPLRIELRYLRGDQAPVWVAITSTMLRDAAGSPLYAVSQTEDITPRREAEEARSVIERRYTELIERSNDLIFTLDLTGVLTSVNPAARSITGFEPAELVGKRLIDLVPEDDLEDSGLAIDRLLEGHDGTSEFQVATKDGGVVHVEASSRLVLDGDAPTEIEAIGRDATTRHLLQKELERRAFYDSLTGLPNRALFLDRLGQAVARPKLPGQSVAVMVLGLDGFKKANSRVGHAGGDEVLKALGPLLQGTLRGSDTVARLGGDEFALIVENLQSQDHVPIVAGRILGTVAALECAAGVVSASLGVALADDSSRPDALLENADTAMRRAKRLRRGGFEVYAAEVRPLRPVSS